MELRAPEGYIADRVAKLFPKAELVRQNEMLPGGNVADLHLRSARGEDIFVEIKNAPIKKTYISQLVRFYTAIANSQPPPKAFKILLVGERIEPSVRRQLSELNAEFLSLKEAGLPPNITTQPGRAKLTRKEASLVAALESRRKKLVTPSYVAKLLACSRNYGSVLLHRLEQKQWVDRISNGSYTFIPATAGYERVFPSLNPLLAASALISPYYFSYSTANAHYGLTTQLPAIVHVATTAKKPIFRWRNTSFKFVTVVSRKFFGFTTASVLGAEVNMAEIEKAIIDSIDKPHYAGGVEEVTGVVYRAYRRVDKKKLVDYALRMKTGAVCQRLGVLLDFLADKGLVEHLDSALRNRLQRGVGMAPIYLGRGGKSSYSRDWHVVNTLPDSQLLSEIEIR